jgi:hypothetical protein
MASVSSFSYTRSSASGPVIERGLNLVITRPLTESELPTCNFKSQAFMTDTLTLSFYCRLLTDNRLQICGVFIYKDIGERLGLQIRSAQFDSASRHHTSSAT